MHSNSSCDADESLDRELKFETIRREYMFFASAAGSVYRQQRHNATRRVLVSLFPTVDENGRPRLTTTATTKT
jgi:hypothetical protein